MLASTPIDVVADFFPAFDAHDKMSALPVLQRVETLVMVGASDLLTPEEHSRDIVRAVPGAELVIIPDCGHLIICEYPDVVNHHLRELAFRARRLAGLPQEESA
jgi:pimeloyl-ACP methyl ester carboxylesterase